MKKSIIVVVGLGLLALVIWEFSLNKTKREVLGGDQKASKVHVQDSSASPKTVIPISGDHLSQKHSDGQMLSISRDPKSEANDKSMAVGEIVKPEPKTMTSSPSVVVQQVSEATDTATAIDLDKISLILRDYRTITGENPVGTNSEIMRALMGENPKGAKLGPPEGQILNGNGELTDKWGTPFFFHQLSRDRMEIRSAGPDKILWTGDDIITK